MKLPKEVLKRLIDRYGPGIDFKKDAGVLPDIVAELAPYLTQTESALGTASAAPFGVSWMDSWVAHWIYGNNLRIAETRDAELASALRGLADLRFDQRLSEIRDFIRDTGGLVAEPPDGGPPEPGTPPAGPAGFSTSPDGGPPDGGPPEPGVPPAGPQAGIIDENPWILYWFMSVRTPLLLDVIDAHITRRLNDMRQAG